MKGDRNCDEDFEDFTTWDCYYWLLQGTKRTHVLSIMGEVPLSAVGDIKKRIIERGINPHMTHRSTIQIIRDFMKVGLASQHEEKGMCGLTFKLTPLGRRVNDLVKKNKFRGEGHE